MRTCCECGASFAPTGNGYRCPPCRKAYDQAWRAKRKAEAQVIFARSPLEAAIDFGALPPLTLAEIEGGDLLAQFNTPLGREQALLRAQEWNRLKEKTNVA